MPVNLLHCQPDFETLKLFNRIAMYCSIVLSKFVAYCESYPHL